MTGAPLLVPASGAALLHGGAEFSWSRFDVHVSVLVGCVLFAGLYLLAVGAWRARLGGPAEPVARGRIAAFLSGVAILFLALNGPIHDLSDNFLFSAHMFQHMLLMLIVPPLLLLGVPAWLVRAALRVRGVTPLARALTHPIVAYVVYNAIFIGWHFPGLYNRALVDHDLHIVQHLMFMAAATMMWWPAVSPAPELQRIPEGLLQMGYLFAFAIPATVVSAFITMSDRVLYPFYEAAPRVFGLSPLEDQRLGGVIMWIPGMLIFWVAIGAIFFRWTRDEMRSWKRGPVGPGSGASAPGR